MRIRLLIGLLIFGSFGNLSSATQEPMVLTLEQSVQIALERNPGFKAAEKELAKAKAAVWEAYSSLLPNVEGSASFQHAWDIQKNTIPNFLKPMLGPLADLIPQIRDMPDFIQLSFGLENVFTYGVTLTQPVFLGGAGVSGVQMALAGQRAAVQSLKAKKQELIYQASDAFYRCLLAKELVAVQEEALAQATANLQMVMKKYENGSASGFDKMRAEVEAANLKPSLISARNGYQLALTGLRHVLALEENAPLQIQGGFVYQEDEIAQMSLVDLQNKALQNRPEKHALQEQIYISKKGLTVARSQFMPKVFFQTSYSKLAMKNDYHFRDEDFSTGFTSAVSLQIPLFTGFRHAKQYQKAQLDYKIMLDNEKQITDGIKAEVEVAYNNFQEGKENYTSAAESVSLAKEALRLANLLYEEGASTQLDVLNSNLALNRAQLNYANSVYDYQMARYQLRRVIGELNDIL